MIKYSPDTRTFNCRINVKKIKTAGGSYGFSTKAVLRGFLNRIYRSTLPQTKEAMLMSYSEVLEVFVDMKIIQQGSVNNYKKSGEYFFESKLAAKFPYRYLGEI